MNKFIKQLRQNKLLQTNIDLNMKLNKVKKLIKNCLSHYYEFKNEIYIENSQKVIKFLINTNYASF